MIDLTGLDLAAAATEEAEEDLEEALEGLTAGDWISAGAILLDTIVVSRLVQRLVSRLVQRGNGGGQASRFVGRVFAALVLAVGFVYGVRVARGGEGDAEGGPT